MCGIGGIFHADLSPPELTSVLARIGTAVAHRGPDGEGWTVEPQLGAGLTCRRLSLVGVENGHQPIDNEDGTLSLVANCEIYNHRQLRRRLERDGHRFRTDSDAEVIVHLYEERSVECFTALDGMFAVAILDRRQGRLVLARDGCGMKQLYHTTVGHTFVFASEVKALLATGLVDAEPDWDGLDTYLAVGYVPAPRSCFRGIHKLQAGSHLVIDGKGHHHGHFWRLRYAPHGTVRSHREYASELERLLSVAVASHLDAETPVGMFLSGGWDSSLVATMAAARVGVGLRTFSIVFPDSRTCNEGDFAALMARHLRADHHEIEFRSGDLPHALDDAVWFREEPFTGPVLLEYQLASLAGRHVKAVLGGQGADELFGGYDWLRSGRAWYRCRRLVPAALARSVGVHVARGAWRQPLRVLGAPDDVAADIEWFRKLTPREKDAILCPQLRSDKPDIEPYRPHPDTLASCSDRTQRRMSLDFTRRLTDGILVTNDRMAMAHGLEVRLPFLDRRVVEFALSLPTELKVRGDQEKYVLSLLTGLLPPEIAGRRKFGLQVPLADYFEGPLRPFLYERLLDASATSIFDRVALENHLRRWLGGQRPKLDAPWCLLVLRAWWDQFFGPTSRARTLAHLPRTGHERPHHRQL